MECNIRNTVASMPQLWNWLENWRSENEKISKWIWKAVEDKIDKAKVAEAEGERMEEIKDVKREE